MSSDDRTKQPIHENPFNFDELKSKLELRLKPNNEFWNLSVLVYHTHDILGDMRNSQIDELHDLVRKYHKFVDGDDEARFWMAYYDWCDLADPQCDRDGISSEVISEFEANYRIYTAVWENPLIAAANKLSPCKKKYEFTGCSVMHDAHFLRRIRRLSDGLLGGWIEKEENLSQEGECFVYHEAMVYGPAKVYGNAVIKDSAIVYSHAQVYDEAEVSGFSKVHGLAKVCGHAQIYGSALGRSDIYGRALVCDDAKVYDARIRGNVKITGEVNYDIVTDDEEGLDVDPLDMR